MSYFAIVKNEKVIHNTHTHPDRHQKLITPRASSFAHAYHIWSTSVSAFVSVILLTE